MRIYAIQVAAVAERHIRTIVAWWAANRRGAPELFERELAEAFRQLASAPHIGSPYAAPRPVGTRRLLLRRTGHHLYYTVDDARGLVTVRAVWHAARGQPPRLG